MDLKKDSDGTFSLCGMSFDDLDVLSSMIQGSGIIERRVFYPLIKKISDLGNE
jgi:hypothetical protein